MNIKAIISVIFSFSILLVPSVAMAKSVDDSCRAVEAIYVRGSGEVTSISRGLITYRDGLSTYLGNDTLHLYELGTEEYGGGQYPAVDVSNIWNGNALGAFVTSGYGGVYGGSVDSGVREMYSYVNQRAAKCPDTYFIFGGYSQGAQVVGQVLPGLSQSVRDRIVFVGLFGDPKLNLPEGFGIFPPACDGHNLSPYRRDIGSCHVFRGSLNPRVPYLPTDFASKTGLWCYSNDFICGSSYNPFNTSGHMIYGSEGMAIDDAVGEATQRLKSFLPADKADYISMVNTERTNLRGHDIVLMVDPGELNEFTIGTLKQQVSTLANNIVGKLGHVALAESYMPNLLSENDSSSAVRMSDFADGILGFQSELGSIDVIDRSHVASASQMLTGIKDMMEQIDWSPSSSRALYYLTGTDVNRKLDTDDGAQIPIIDQSRTSGGVAVSAVAFQYGTDGQILQDIVDATGGTLYNNVPVVPALAVMSDDTGQSDEIFSQIIDDISVQPTLRLPIDEYSVVPGGSIMFDLSGSDLHGATIDEYQWDYDDDGTVDEATKTPIAEHVYSSPFDGHMSVYAMTADGHSSVATATIHVGEIVIPNVPQSPSQLQISVLSTTDRKSDVKASWQVPADLPDHYVLSLNGVALGILTNDRTTIEIRDIDRNYDNEIGIAGASADGSIGDVTTATLEKLPDQVDEPAGPGERIPRNHFNDRLQKIFDFVKLILSIVLH